MSRGRRLAAALSVFALVLFAGVPVIAAQDSSEPAKTIHGDNGIALPAPPVATVDVVTDDYSGTKIEDPYRWLEDAKSPATRAWIDEENAYTKSISTRSPPCRRSPAQLTSLMRVDSTPRQSCAPENTSSRNASPTRTRDPSTCASAGMVDQRLMDATKLSADQNTSANMIGRLERWQPADLRDSRRRRRRRLRAHPQRRHRRRSADFSLRALLRRQPQPRQRRPLLREVHPPGHQRLVPQIRHARCRRPHALRREYRGKQLGELDLVGVHVTDNQHFLIVSIAHGVPATAKTILVEGPAQARAAISSRSSTTSKPTSASSTPRTASF